MTELAIQNAEPETYFSPTAKATDIGRVPSAVLKALSAMQGHGLDDLNKAKLMRRVDTKFLLPIDRLADVLQLMSGHYSVLDFDGVRTSQYRTIYYDTPCREFFHDHHRGRMNRYKVRHRLYEDTDTAFLEVKLKGNKGYTNKKRINVQTTASDDLLQHQAFLQKLNVPYIEQLIPLQQGSYKRIALANELEGERLTLDFDLSFSRYGEEDTEQNLGALFIAELKQPRLHRNTPFVQLMRSWNIRSGNFSKYCIGSCLLDQDNLKHNRFKPIIHKLKQFNSDGYTTRAA